MEAVRYVIIAVPPDSVRLPLARLIDRVAAVSDSRTAAEYPPHITLRTGVLVPEEEHASFDLEFGAVVGSLRPVDTHLGDLIRHNGEDRFIGYSIPLSKELATLNEGLLSYRSYRKSDRTDFLLHLSIAYGDLTPQGYEAATRWLDSHPDEIPSDLGWQIDRVSLFRREGSTWLLGQHFPLGHPTD